MNWHMINGNRVNLHHIVQITYDDDIILRMSNGDKIKLLNLTVYNEVIIKLDVLSKLLEK